MVVKTAENVLNEYLKETSGISIDEVKEKPSEEICDVLKKFYCGARKKYGSTYAKTTMISMRYGLQKSSHKSNGIDIVKNDTFKRANEVFSACLVKIKKEGTSVVKHKDVIIEGDIKRLYESGVFSTESPKTLQKKFFFLRSCCFFCNRGRENLRNMRSDDYVIKEDPDGRRYAVSAVSRLTKNHRGEGGDDGSNANAVRMYDRPGMF